MMRLFPALFTLQALLLSTPALCAQMPDVGFDQRMNAQVPLDLTFRDEHGEDVALRSLCHDRPVILVLGYYRCPRLCTPAFTKLAECLGQVSYQLGRDYAVITVSIDPHETAESAAAKKAAIVEHAELAGADSAWHFLTGTEPAIKRLADTVGFRFTYDADRDVFVHAAGFVVLTPDGKVSRYFFGLDYSRRDVGFALEDASAGTIGSPVTQPLRMLCFAYDPVAGKYTLMSLRLMQLGGAVTVAALAFYLIRAFVFRRHLVKAQ
jgi:protein SCO1/2